MNAHAITVEAEVCPVCGRDKPRTEFYDSELRELHPRCKSCCRARVAAANKRDGRRSTSLSASEIRWLGAVLRALPSSDLRDLARRREYIGLARKIASMAGADGRPRQKGLV